jgi:hypothetical protein
VNRKFVNGAVGAGIIGVVALTLGLVFRGQATFSKNYVHDQLVEHKIRFLPVAALTAEQRRVPCLVSNAGQPLTSSKQAECYAKYQIGIDMLAIANGKGYSEVHYAAYLLRLKSTEAVRTHPNDPATLVLVQQSTELSRQGDDLLAGETVRGLLLTAYGFGLLGERGGQAATASFAITGVMVLAVLACIALANRSKRQVGASGATDPISETSTPRHSAHGDPAMWGVSGDRH